MGGGWRTQMQGGCPCLLSVAASISTMTKNSKLRKKGFISFHLRLPGHHLLLKKIRAGAQAAGTAQKPRRSSMHQLAPRLELSYLYYTAEAKRLRDAAAHDGAGSSSIN